MRIGFKVSEIKEQLEDVGSQIYSLYWRLYHDKYKN